MGLIKAALGSAGGTLADQWKEYFYCDALPADVLAVKGKKRVSGRSSNKHGSDNIISNGSVIAINEGQCMMIVEQGKIVDVCAEPGEYTYDMSTEPSIFTGDLSTGIQAVFQNVGKRFTFGGEPPKDQRVYFFNTKELMGNKYGTPSSIPVRMLDANINLDTEINIRCFGEYSYRVTNPLLFYTNVCGNVESEFTRDQIEGQMKTELLTALQPALCRVTESGIRYSALIGHTGEIADQLNQVLSAKWRDKRGIEIVDFGISSLKADEKDEARIKNAQDRAVLRDAGMREADRAYSADRAMEYAAQNANGAMGGFVGMGMAMNQGASLREQEMQQQLFQMQQQMQQMQMNRRNVQPGPTPSAPAPDGDSWTCTCGNRASGKFCPECGAKKPAPVITLGGWTCPSCGNTNKGKFCTECGAKKPEGTPKFVCDKCGWEPADPISPPKFCPECGDPFDENDKV